MNRMTRVVAGALLAAVVVAPGLAPAETGLTKGIEVGLNMANVTGSDADPKAVTGNSGATKSSVMGLAGGIFVGIGLGPIMVQGEALYSMKGVKYEWGTNSMQLDIAYLDIPVTLKYDVLPGPIAISVFAGPSLGILMSSKMKSDNGSTTQTKDVKDTTASTDLGIVAGVGVGLPMGLRANVRYQVGLSSLDKPASGATAAKMYNGVITLMVGKSF